MIDESDLPLLTTVGDVGDPDPRILDAARAAVLDAVRTAVRTGAILRRKRRRRVLLISTAAATVAAVGLPLVNLGGDRPGAEANAAAFLRAVAIPAASGPNGCDAPFWYSRSRFEQHADAGAGLGPAEAAMTREAWLGHTAPGHMRQGGDAAGLGPAVFPLGAASLTWDEVCSLPTDPRKLFAKMQHDVGDAGPDRDTETFVAIGDLLRESPAPPAVRAALYGAAAMVPGVTLLGDVRDATGRAATAIRRVHDRLETRYLIDPSTGVLLEEQLMTADGSAVAFRSTYLAAGPVQDDHTALP